MLLLIGHKLQPNIQVIKCDGINFITSSTGQIIEISIYGATKLPEELFITINNYKKEDDLFNIIVTLHYPEDACIQIMS